MRKMLTVLILIIVAMLAWNFWNTRTFPFATWLNQLPINLKLQPEKSIVPKKDPIVISLKKQEFHHSDPFFEPIEFTIKNNHSQTIYFLTGCAADIPLVYMEVNNNLERLPSPPIICMALPMVTEVKPSDEKTFTWNQKIGTGKFVLDGEYKLAVEYSYKKIDQFKIGASKEIVYSPTVSIKKANTSNYTNDKLGIIMQLPLNLRVTQINLPENVQIRITDENIKYPEDNFNPQDIAYKYTEKCKPQPGGCASSAILKGFSYRITRGKVMRMTGYSSDDYIKSYLYKDTVVTISGNKAYRKEGSIIVPGTKALGKSIIIELIKGDDLIEFTSEFPVNKKKYEELFNQLMSTIKIVD